MTFSSRAKTTPIGHSVNVQPQGFTIVEILVATVLIAIVTSMAAAVMIVSNRATSNSSTMGNAMAAIDNDISLIKTLSERYTCCSGTCTTDPATIAAATTKCEGSVGDSVYYFPRANNASEIASFQALCDSGLTTNLIAAINAQAQPVGVSRTAVDDGDATARRVRITYTGTNINRVVKVVPTVANWCP